MSGRRRSKRLNNHEPEAASEAEAEGASQNTLTNEAVKRGRAASDVATVTMTAPPAKKGKLAQTPRASKPPKAKKRQDDPEALNESAPEGLNEKKQRKKSQPSSSKVTALTPDQPEPSPSEQPVSATKPKPKPRPKPFRPATALESEESTPVSRTEPKERGPPRANRNPDPAALQRTKQRRSAAEVQAERDARAEADDELEKLTLENTQKIIDAKVRAARRTQDEQGRMVKDMPVLAPAGGDTSEEDDDDLMDVDVDEQEPSTAATRRAQPADTEMIAGDGCDTDGASEIASQPSAKSKRMKVPQTQKEGKQPAKGKKKAGTRKKKNTVLRAAVEERVKATLAESQDGPMVITPSNQTGIVKNWKARVARSKRKSTQEDVTKQEAMGGLRDSDVEGERPPSPTPASKQFRVIAVVGAKASGSKDADSSAMRGEKKTKARSKAKGKGVATASLGAAPAAAAASTPAVTTT